MYRIALVSRSKSNVPVTRNWRNIGKSTSCFRMLSSSGSNRTSNNSNSSSQKCCILSSVNKFDNTTSIRRRYFSTQTEIKPFLLADIGEGIAEVEILQWFVKEGDKVKAFDKICEVQSDKATVDISSRYDGDVVKIHHEAGEMVQVGHALLDIGTVPKKSSNPSASKMSSENPDKPEKLSVPPSVNDNNNNGNMNSNTANASDGHSGKVLTTPAVRRLARDHALDLGTITGSGPNGRILKEDVLAFVGNGAGVGVGHHPTRTNIAPTPFSTSVTATTPVSAPTEPVTIAPPAMIKAPVAQLVEDVKVPIRGVARLMVKSMTAAREVQHLTYGDEIEVNKLKDMRARMKVVAEAQGIKLTFLSIMIKAASMALTQYPSLNATVNNDITEITQHAAHNIGIAMDTDQGLVVPVIHNVQHKSILEIAQDLQHLQTLAANNQLTESHFRGGTFTLSNIGAVGGTFATPVVVVPQVMIGALCRMQTVPRYIDTSVDDGELEVVPTSIMNVSWSADHRVVDGASVAKFSNTFKAYLEEPALMLGAMR